MGFLAEGGVIAGRGGFLQVLGDFAGGGEIAGRDRCWPRAGGGILYGLVVRL